MIELVYFIIVFDHLFLVIFKCIERVEERKHSFCKLLSLRDINFHVERKWNIVENVLSKPGQSIVLQILE